MMAKPKLPMTTERDPQEMADAIVAISEGMKRLLAGPLNMRAIVVLIQDACPAKDRPTRDQIATVLNTTSDLARVYTRKR